MIRTTVRRMTLLVAVGGAGLTLLAGCSSATSSDPTSSNGATTSTPTKGTPSSSLPAKATPTKGTSAAAGDCTEVSILAALPAGSTMDKFQCEVASPTMWAAASVKPGPSVYFLQTTSGPWKVSTADQICGKPPAGLPKEIKAFCPKA